MLDENLHRDVFQSLHNFRFNIVEDYYEEYYGFYLAGFKKLTFLHFLKE